MCTMRSACNYIKSTRTQRSLSKDLQFCSGSGGNYFERDYHKSNKRTILLAYSMHFRLLWRKYICRCHVPIDFSFTPRPPYACCFQHGFILWPLQSSLITFFIYFSFKFSWKKLLFLFLVISFRNITLKLWKKKNLGQLTNGSAISIDFMLSSGT